MRSGHHISSQLPGTDPPGASFDSPLGLLFHVSREQRLRDGLVSYCFFEVEKAVRRVSSRRVASLVSCTHTHTHTHIYIRFDRGNSPLLAAVASQPTNQPTNQPVDRSRETRGILCARHLHDRATPRLLVASLSHLDSAYAPSDIRDTPRYPLSDSP